MLNPVVVLFISLFCSIYMTGLIWFVQIVHYPLFKMVPAGDLQPYAVSHAHRTGFVVAIHMILELLSAIYLVIAIPEWISIWEAYTSLILILIIFASTFFLQVPQHNIIQNGGNVNSIHILTNTNWIRTFCWSIRSILLLYITYRLVVVSYK